MPPARKTSHMQHHPAPFFAVTLVMLSLFSPTVTPAANQDVGDDPLLAELVFLRQQVPADVGRDQLAAEYEAFINKSTEMSRDPIAVSAMLDLAGMFKSVSIPSQDARQDPTRALEWYRRAAAQSEHGSSQWFEATLNQARLVGRNDHEAARLLLHDMQPVVMNDSLRAAMVEYEIYSSYLSQRDMERATDHARRLLGWYSDPARVPANQWVKSDLENVMRSSAQSIVVGWRNARGFTAAERIGRIRQIINEFPALMFLQKYGMEEIEHLKNEEDEEFGNLVKSSLDSIADPISAQSGSDPHINDHTEQSGNDNSAASAHLSSTAGSPTEIAEGSERIAWAWSASVVGATVIIITGLLIMRRQKLHKAA